jgi:TolB-like protein
MSGEAPESRQGQTPTSPSTGGRPPPSVTSGAAIERPPQTLTRTTDSVWDRIKRHKVVEWTLAYLAFGYALLHGVQMLRETFEWPLLIPRLTVFVLLVGVPVAVTLAWYHGHRAQHRISGAELSILIALLLVAGSVLWWASRMGSTHVASAVADATHFNTPLGDKSIAVLPFVDLSERHDQEYFADGMAEEILDLLATIPAIKVIGRTSSFQFKGKNEDLRTIGGRLGAAFVVEGSVRKSGDRVRVTAQLIGTGDGVHRWSETYDRDMDDVLKLQDEIAAGIVRALEVTVSADRPSARATVKNAEAYDLYLRGRHATDRYDPHGLGEAVDYFQQALDLDPTLAVAAASLGAARVFQAISGFVAVREAYDRARRECALALRLDPQLAAPHATLGTILLIYDWDWTAADSEIKKALSLEARNPIALDAAALLASIRGQHDQVLRLTNSLLAADPLNPRAHFWLGFWLYQSGRPTDAARSFEDTLRISPTYADAQYYLTLALLAQGEKEKALHVIERASDESERLAGLSIVHSAMGHKAESDAALAALTKRDADKWAFGIASVHAFRGERDEALAWLDRAVTQRDEDLIDIKGEPLIAGLHDDPRYKALLRKMKLPEEQGNQASSADSPPQSSQSR